MRLDAITAEPRPRHAWEATDLGIRDLPGLLRRQALAALTWRRFDTARSFTLPVRQLEGLNGKARLVTLTGYDLPCLNTDTPIPKLVAALQRRPQGVFCFYGPAGTGKSELACHIADALEKPLLVKRASDLLDKYVGETEQRIAEMFSDARQWEVVLVQDEADSFLHEQCSARQSW